MTGDYNPVDMQGKQDCFEAFSHLGQAGLMSLMQTGWIQSLGSWSEI